MRRLPDVPPQLWLSDAPLCRAGNRMGTSKMAWTPALVRLCETMRAHGDTWLEVAGALEQETGVRIAPKSVQNYLSLKHVEE